MPSPLVILDDLPSAVDFYGLYWNRRPFLVRRAIGEDAMAALIGADVLAGLAMEEAPQSRMVMTAGDHHDWSCRFGPFTEDDFAAAGDADWSLLVQNVEQFHPETATLLRYFNFAPRWLMDDIMVSFSAKGGSVGPHVDSYHVFLVQGQGTRRWKVARTPLLEEVYIQGLELKILETNFDGDDIDVTSGDVLYVPPKFAHQGTTIDDALTFSVGFLGPKLSELYGSYGQYLSEFEGLDQRYVGDGLGPDSAGFVIGADAAQKIQGSLTRQLGAKDFTRWLVEFFTESAIEDFGEHSERGQTLDVAAFGAELKKGTGLTKPEYIKFAITQSADGEFFLGFNRRSYSLSESATAVLHRLMVDDSVTLGRAPELLNDPATIELLCELYNHQGLEFYRPGDG